MVHQLKQMNTNSFVWANEWTKYEDAYIAVNCAYIFRIPHIPFTFHLFLWMSKC
jgi:hypothetical protein